MTRTTIALVALLGCVVLFTVWIQGEEEASSVSQSPSEQASLPSDRKPRSLESQRPGSLLDQRKGSSDRSDELPSEPDARDVRGRIVAKKDIKERLAALANRAVGRRVRPRARPDTKPDQRREQGGAAGDTREQLSRREPDSALMNDTEQPPSREPLQAEEEDDEDTLEHWRDVALRNPDPDERENAISELDLDDPAAMDVLIQTLDDRDPAVRLAALSALWLAADEPPTGILAPLINDPDPEVRIEVVGMLADSEEPRARQLLRSALDDADEDVRDAAASALDLD